MFYIFEMANNHQGSVDHAFKIVDRFSELAKKYNVNAAVKLQFRQLDSFIHNDFKNSDLKFVKRFNSTRLSFEQFNSIVERIRNNGLTPLATPFDNESLKWFEQMDVPMVKIASCSIDDWPLLEEVAKINKKIIISTGGADMKTLRKVYSLFKQNGRDFAFMHCVGEYPTPVEASNLNRINLIRAEFPDIEIGFSTHESPQEESLAPVAAAMGCTLIEKHVGVETNTISLNAYSNTYEQMENMIQSVQRVEGALNGKSKVEKKSLAALKRGVFLNRDVPAGTVITRDMLYFAMPCADGQRNVASINKILGTTAVADLTKDAPLAANDHRSNIDQDLIRDITTKATQILTEASIPLHGREGVEISCHYGLNQFHNYGALIIDKINREYCKKLIIVNAGQSHPKHRHIKKEEAFELLHGDCKLNLNGKDIQLVRGKPVLISRGVVHSFSSENGCVVEEISTTHIPGDSIYEDPYINSLPLSERKIKIKLV